MPNNPTVKPLTLREYSNQKHLPLDYLTKTWGVHEVHCGGVRCVEQPYTGCDGSDYAPRFRFADAKKSPAHSGDRITLYGLKQLINRESDQIILVEGESDTQTLHFARYNVLGVPGTSMWDTCVKNDPTILTLLSGKTLIVIQEPPSAKERAKRLDSPVKMMARIKASLPSCKIVAVRLWEFAPRDADGEPLYKDVSGLWTYYGGLTGFQRFMDALHIASRAAAKRDEAGSRQIQSVRASDIEMALTRWLWFEHIPVGDLTVFAGMPQKGKSTAAIDVVARLTTGKDFPAGSVKQVDPCEVAILASEDNPKTTTVPRLRAAGADVERVHLITGTGDGKQQWDVALDRDLDQLRDFLLWHADVKLVVMDPVTSYIGDVDPNKPKEVRPFLNKLKRFAEDMGISLLLIMHLSKNPDVSALHRVGGAATWIEVPRSVWFFDLKKQDDENAEPSYVMVNGKLNIVADNRKKALEYAFAGVDVSIEGVQQSMGTIKWGEESAVTLEQQYSKQTREKPGPKPVQLEAAVEWLRDYLGEGPQKSSEIFADGRDHGHAKDTLYKAKDQLRIVLRKLGSVWTWRLPDEPEATSGSCEANYPI